MSEKTAIQWTDHTFNVAWGCTKVSPGCANCYAEGDSKRYGFDVWGADAERRTFGDKHWNEPLKWNRDAVREGRRHRVFTSSMCDVLDDHATIRAQLPRLLALIAATPALDWQVLTKRSENLALVPRRSNVWLGVSVESFAYALRVDDLRATNAAVKFVSFEPLLGDVCAIPLVGIDWAIFGGESRGGRACDVAWIRSGIARCRRDGAAPFVKQLGSKPRTTDGAQLDWPVRAGFDDVAFQPERAGPAPGGGQWWTIPTVIDRKGGDMDEWPIDLRVREFPVTP